MQNTLKEPKHVNHASLTGLIRTSLARLIDSKQKKWVLFSILFFLIASLDDYAVATLSIPPFEKLTSTNGVLTIEMVSGGKSPSGGDILHIKNSKESVELRCRINSSDRSYCIPENDFRFYDWKFGGESWLGKTVFIKPITSKKIIHAQAWWYEANYFGPLKEKRLLQLDVEGTRVIAYEQQKVKYMQQKNNHFYMLTILLILSIIWFCALQLINKSMNT